MSPPKPLLPRIPQLVPSKRRIVPYDPTATISVGDVPLTALSDSLVGGESALHAVPLNRSAVPNVPTAMAVPFEDHTPFNDSAVPVDVAVQTPRLRRNAVPFPPTANAVPVGST